MKVGRTIFPSRPSTYAQEVAATTCRSQWRRDARVLCHSNTLCSDATHADLRVPPCCGSWDVFSLGCQPGSSESAPCVTWAVFRVAAPSFVPPLPGGRRPLTHSPRREVVSGPAHTRGAHPTASGRLQTVVLFRQSYPALTNGGVVDAVVPCGP